MAGTERAPLSFDERRVGVAGWMLVETGRPPTYAAIKEMLCPMMSEGEIAAAVWGLVEAQESGALGDEEQAALRDKAREFLGMPT